MNRYRTILIAILSAFAVPLSAQELTYEVGFETMFDNREYSQTVVGESMSGSDFAARISPQLGLAFAKGNSINLGLEAMQPFGIESKGIFADTQLLLYYAFDAPMWSASAGLFQRDRMSVDSYSTAFFSADYLFYDNIMSGIMGRYGKSDSYVEFVCDWESQPTLTTREQFRLLSAARYSWSKFYVGYNLSVTHFAGEADGGRFGNVVDNALLNPVVGFKSSGTYDFDMRLSLLQSMQRDREYENEWLSPRMGEIAMKISRWGFSIDERFYLGDDLFPLYDGHTLDDGTVMEYGEQLYTGDIFFRTAEGFYNRAALSYGRSFFNDQMKLKVHFVTHCDKSGLGTEQLIDLSIKIGGVLYNSDKYK